MDFEFRIADGSYICLNIYYVVGGMRDAFSHFARPFLWPYFIFGSCTVFSGFILFAIPFLQRKKSSEHQMEMDLVNFHSEKDVSYSEQQQKL